MPVKNKTKKKSAPKKTSSKKSWRPDGLCFKWARRQVDKDKEGCDKQAKDCKFKHKFESDKARKWAKEKFASSE